MALFLEDYFFLLSLPPLLMRATLQKFSLLVLLLCTGLITFAQGKKVDVDIDIHKGNDASTWINNPVIWIAGGAVFILILVAILRGGRSRRA